MERLCADVARHETENLVTAICLARNGTQSEDTAQFCKALNGNVWHATSWHGTARKIMARNGWRG